MNMKNIVSNKISEKLLCQQFNAIDFLDSIRMRYAIIKGVVLSNYCYNNIISRGIGDVDILISRQQIKSLEQLLFNHDFFQVRNTSRFDRVLLVTTSHQFVPYFKKTLNSSVIIDINFDIFWGEYEGKRIDIEEFLSDTVEMEIYAIKVKTLPPIKAIIQLILHHYKDMNSLFLLSTRKSIKYDMFKDVYFLLKNNLNVIPLDKLYTMSAEYEIIPYVYYVLYYTGQVFQDDVLQQYVEAFRTPEGETLLNCYGLCAKEQKEWKCDFKTRLEAENLYDLIKDDLTEKDKEKIAINKRVFLGVSE